MLQEIERHNILRKKHEQVKDKNLSMEEAMPSVYKKLKQILLKLEKYYKDMQDVNSQLRIKFYGCYNKDLEKEHQNHQLRLIDMVNEKLISKKEAVLRLDPNTLDTLLHPTLDEKEILNVIAKGLPASPEPASGKVVFTSNEAERLNGMMQSTILVERDIPRGHSWYACSKRNTYSKRRMTSHAAVVARNGSSMRFRF